MIYRDEMELDCNILKLSRELSKALCVSAEDAMSIIYEEWDSVEQFFDDNIDTKDLLSHLIDEINCCYRIA